MGLVSVVKYEGDGDLLTDSVYFLNLISLSPFPLSSCFEYKEFQENPLKNCAFVLKYLKSKVFCTEEL